MLAECQLGYAGIFQYIGIYLYIYRSEKQVDERNVDQNLFFVPHMASV
jgi:hypothetical protein